MTEPANYAALRPKPLNWTWSQRALPPGMGMVKVGPAGCQPPGILSQEVMVSTPGELEKTLMIET